MSAALRTTLGDRGIGAGEVFDLVVIGAGITGVQLAREAAIGGASVVLVDQGDLGSGTSSATTKYLHGGIRYLEQGDVAVVRESLRERRILALAAPHLVQQMPFVLPVWSWSHPGAVVMAAGGLAYDVLSFDRNRGAPDALRIGHPRPLGRRATLARVPWIDPTDLRGSLLVTDTLNVHPERLLLELALDAVAAGALVCTHTPVTGFAVSSSEYLRSSEYHRPGSGAADTRRRGDTRMDVVVTGVRVRDRDGAEHEIGARRVVNAAGPWIAEVLDGVLAEVAGVVSGGPGPSGRRRRIGPRVTPSKGVHLLTHPTSGRRGGATAAVMARGRSGRHVVVSPWIGREFVGPTDTPVAASPSEVAVEATDVDELLALTNSCSAPGAELAAIDVDDVTVGIRPLVAVGTAAPTADAPDGGDDGHADQDRSTYTASRRHHLFDHAVEGVAGLWSIAGGKWTTGRATAEEVCRSIGLPGSGRRSRQLAVGSATGFGADPQSVHELVDRYRPDVVLTAGVRTHLARLSGTRATTVIDHCGDDPALTARVSLRPGCADIAAQVVVAVTDEGAQTLADIVDRRLVLGTLGEVSRSELEAVAAIAAPLLGWPDRGSGEAAAEHGLRRTRRQRWQRQPTTR